MSTLVNLRQFRSSSSSARSPTSGKRMSGTSSTVCFKLDKQWKLDLPKEEGGVLNLGFWPLSGTFSLANFLGNRDQGETTG